MKNSNYANNNAFGGYGGQSQSEVGRGYGATGGGPYGSSVSSNSKAAGVGGLNPNAPQFNSDPFVRAPGGQPGVGIRTSPTQSAQQQKFNNNYNTRGQQQYAGVSSQQQQPQFNLQQLLGSQSINSTLSMLQQQQQQQQAAPPPPGPPDELSFNALGGLTGGKTIKVGSINFYVLPDPSFCPHFGSLAHKIRTHYYTRGHGKLRLSG